MIRCSGISVSIFFSPILESEIESFSFSFHFQRGERFSIGPDSDLDFKTWILWYVVQVPASMSILFSLVLESKSFSSRLFPREERYATVLDLVDLPLRFQFRFYSVNFGCYICSVCVQVPYPGGMNAGSSIAERATSRRSPTLCRNWWKLPREGLATCWTWQTRWAIKTHAPPPPSPVSSFGLSNRETLRSSSFE